jgi:hypothetical protein
MSLSELAQRVEMATGHDKALDGAIWLAVRADEPSRRAYADGQKVSKAEAAFRLDYMSEGFRPTISLDAAITLVPEGWRLGFEENASCDEPGKAYAWCWPFESNYDPDWQLGQEGQQSNPDAVKGYAASPALAVSAAALRAIDRGEGA